MTRAPTEPQALQRGAEGDVEALHTLVQAARARRLRSSSPGVTTANVIDSESKICPLWHLAEVVKAGELLGLGFALVVGWTTQGFPVGVSSRNHSTDSTGYAIAMSGAVDTELDGTVVHLKAGDVLVQRGTIHNWVSRGAVACVIAFVLIAAKPVTVGGKVLNAQA